MKDALIVAAQIVVLTAILVIVMLMSSCAQGSRKIYAMKNVTDRQKIVEVGIIEESTRWPLLGGWKTKVTLVMDGDELTTGTVIDERNKNVIEAVVGIAAAWFGGRP